MKLCSALQIYEVSVVGATKPRSTVANFLTICYIIVNLDCVFYFPHIRINDIVVSSRLSRDGNGFEMRLNANNASIIRKVVVLML